MASEDDARPTPRGPYAPGRATRELLIRTAERLFAEHGIDGVSLRTLGAAAEQRNTAAVRYHFGNKDGLLAAIFEFRLTEINRHRLAMLDQLEAEDRLDDRRALVEAYLLPLAEQLRPDSWYIELLHRLPTARADHPLWTADPTLTASTDRILHLLTECLHDLPPAVAATRVRMLTTFVVHILADRQSQTRARGRCRPTQKFFLANLVDVATSILSAPHQMPAGRRRPDRPVAPAR